MTGGLTRQSYFILASLLDGPRHGYAITAEADAMSAGQVRLTAGTLYGALGRLSREGLVEVDREEKVAGRQRRYYRLTRSGHEALSAEAERLAQAAKAVQSRASVTQRPQAARS